LKFTVNFSLINVIDSRLMDKTSNQTHTLFQIISKKDKFLSYFFFLKLGIRSKNRLIRGDQSHCPLAGAPFKARASYVWTWPTEIGTRGNPTWDLWKSKLQDPKPTTRPTPNGFLSYLITLFQKIIFSKVKLNRNFI